MGSVVFVACFVMVLLPKLFMHLTVKLEIHTIWPLLLPNVVFYITGHAVGLVLANKKLREKPPNDSTNERKQDQKLYEVMGELIESLPNQQNEFLHQVGKIVSDLLQEFISQQKEFLAVGKQEAGEKLGWDDKEEGLYGMGNFMCEGAERGKFQGSVLRTKRSALPQ